MLAYVYLLKGQTSNASSRKYSFPFPQANSTSCRSWVLEGLEQLSRRPSRALQPSYGRIFLFAHFAHVYLQTVPGAKKDRAQTLSLQFVQSLNACRTYFLSWWSYVDDSAGDNADEGMNLGDEKRAPVGKEWGPNRHGH